MTTALMMSKQTSALSFQQIHAIDFFYNNKGKWFSGTDLHDKAYSIKMNTVLSLVRRGILKTRESYNTEYSYSQETGYVEQ